MKKIVAAASLFAMLSLVGTARAADLSVPSYDWTGLYIGAHAGYGFGSFDDKSFGPNNAHIDGFAGGLLAGYNHQINSIVLGLEGDASLTSIDGDNVPPGFIQDLDINSMFSVRARLGVAIDTVMPFVTGGVAFADVDALHTGDTANVSKFNTGWTIGAGVEWAATDHIRVRGEFLHTDFGSKSYGFFAGADPHTLAIDNVNVARAALIWNF
jgi:outer membrane immunogenic protein